MTFGMCSRRTADGAIGFESYQQEQGMGPQNVANQPDFGHSFSCPFMVHLGINPPVIDPSIKPCCKQKGKPNCCSPGRTLSPGRTGKMGRAVEGSASSLTPDSSAGRLFPSGADPAPPERWG